MEAARTSETSVDNYFTRQYIPEDNSELHTRRRENLKSHILNYVVLFPRVLARFTAFKAMYFPKGLHPVSTLLVMVLGQQIFERNIGTINGAMVTLCYAFRLPFLLLTNKYRVLESCVGT
jgi:hypothetical protein